MQIKNFAQSCCLGHSVREIMTDKLGLTSGENILALEMLTTNYKHNCSAPLLAVCVDRKFHLKKLCLQNETRFPESPTHTRLQFATGFATPRNYQMSTAFTRHGTDMVAYHGQSYLSPPLNCVSKGGELATQWPRPLKLKRKPSEATNISVQIYRSAVQIYRRQCRRVIWELRYNYRFYLVLHE